MNNKTRAAVLLALFCGTCLLCSCDNSPPGAAFNTTNVRRLRTAYNIYVRLNEMKGPASEEDFKEFLKSDLTAKVRLSRIGVELEDLDGIFVSERDGKPFKVRYGLNGSKNHAVVFEAEGIEGKRFVAFWDPIEVEADKYDKYWSGELLADESNGEEAEE